MIRLFDILFAVTVLVVFSPILLVVALAIKATSPGPVLYMAERAGRHNQPFRMFKFRSMHVNNAGSEITSTNDTRVFPVGRIIRKLKLDELPQFLNVLRGEMAIVGPRPEAPAIVAQHYQPWMMKTLDGLPGVTSPGAIYYYAFGDALLDTADPETAYVENLLAPKLALDLAYDERETLASNIFVVAHTAVAVIGHALGRPVGPLARDIERSRQWVDIP